MRCFIKRLFVNTSGNLFLPGEKKQVFSSHIPNEGIGCHGTSAVPLYSTVKTTTTTLQGRPDLFFPVLRSGMQMYTPLATRVKGKQLAEDRPNAFRSDHPHHKNKRKN